MRKEIQMHYLDPQGSVEKDPWHSADSKVPLAACINS